jgi:transcription antitermination factor NusG
MSKFKEGDIVIPNSGAFEGTKCKINRRIREGHYMVESLSSFESRGHKAGGVFDTNRGWGYYERDLELAEPTESTITIRFLTEQEFKHRGLWAESAVCPSGWNKEMNKYLGKTIDLPKLEICKDGSFTYENWHFIKKDYEIVTPSTKNTVTVPQPEVESELELAKEQFPVGSYVKPNYGPFKNVVCKVVNYYSKLAETFIGVESEISSGHNCDGFAKENKGWYYKTSGLIKVDPPKEEPVQASKFKVGDTVIYTGYASNIKGKVLTVTSIVFESKIRYEVKELNSRCTYDIPESFLEKYNPFESATSVVSTEWIPATKLTNPKTDVNSSPELEYHQQPQLIKKPIKKSLITI